MGKIAARYARALLNYSSELNVSEKVYQQLSGFAEIYPGVQGLQTMLENPAIDYKSKENVIATMCDAKEGEALMDFLKFIASQKRMDHIVWIFHHFLELYRKENSIHLAVLTTADDLDEETERMFLLKIQSVYKGTVELVKRINPELIGGYLLEVDGRRWNASVKGMLQQVKKQFSEV